MALNHSSTLRTRALTAALLVLLALGGTVVGTRNASARQPRKTAHVEVGVIHKYKLPKIGKATKRFKIVLLQAHRADAFAISSALAVQQYGKAHGISVTVNDAGGYQNVSKQLGQIDTAISEKADAIIMWSTDPTAVVSELRKAQRAGVKIIGYTQPPNMKLPVVVTGNFVLDGKTMATALFKKIGGKGDVMTLYGGAGSAYQAALLQGFNQAHQAYPNVKVVANQTIPDFDPSKVTNAVADELVRDPNLVGVATSTTAMAVGAADAVAKAGRKGKTFSVGEIIGDCGQIRLLKNGTLPIVLGVPAVYYGDLVTAYAIEYLEGKKVPKMTVIPGNVYTPANINKAPLKLEIAAQFRKGCS
jgi:ribose transport system substrate-binding protein